MSRSVSSVRSSDPWLRRTDRLPLAQCRGLLPGEGKVGQHFFRVLSPGLAAQMHRLFCIFAELLSFSHGAISPESAPYEMSPHFEELSGQNCSLCESSLVVAGGTMHLGEGVSQHPGGPVLYCGSCSRCWNPYPQQWLASGRIALRHWRTPYAALAGPHLYRSAAGI